jgi:Tol biopolymer transport system component
MKQVFVALVLMSFIVPCRVSIAETTGYKIVFLSERDEVKDKPDKHGNIINIGEIYIMNPDGTDQKRLTDNRMSESTLRQFPGMNKMYFTITDGTNSNIAWMDYDGGKFEMLTDDVNTSDSSPVVSHDGKFMIYSSHPYNEHMNLDDINKIEIWKMDLETKEKKSLTNNTSIDIQPVISFDDKEILFLHSKTTYDGEIWTSWSGRMYSFDLSQLRFTLRYMDLETGDEGAFSDESFDYNRAIYSPDNNYVVTAIEKDDEMHHTTLFTWDGVKVTETGVGMGDCDEYKFTPDGSKLIIECDLTRHGYTGGVLFSMDMGLGRTIKKITDDDYMIGCFDITPDNKTIIFSAINRKDIGNLKNQKSNIFSISIDGTDLKQLTNTLEDEYCPAVLTIVAE